MLDDSDSGIRAARAAGVRAVVGVGAPALDVGADVVVADLRGLSWDDDGLHVPAAARLDRAR